MANISYNPNTPKNFKAFNRSSRKSKLDPREQLRRIGQHLPRPCYDLIQAGITALTGKAYSGQQPLFNLSKEGSLAKSLLSHTVGTTGSILIIQTAPEFVFVLPASMLLTVGSVRGLVLSELHQCIHNNFGGTRNSKKLAKALSIVFCLQNYDEYRQEHVKEHHNYDLFATWDDPDAKFLLKLGFRPGLTTEDYRQNFRELLTSPQFHWEFLSARIKSNFVTAEKDQRIFAYIFYAALLIVVTLTHLWIPFLIAWVFPLTILYHISTIFQLCSEHLWGADGTAESKSHARFCGQALPEDPTWKDWCNYILAMVFIHLPTRLGILPDPEITVHDHHHHFPQDNRDWPNAIYNRQRAIDAGASQYTEFWGIHNAMNAVFQSLAEQPALSDEELERLLNS